MMDHVQPTPKYLRSSDRRSLERTFPRFARPSLRLLIGTRLAVGQTGRP